MRSEQKDESTAEVEKTSGERLDELLHELRYTQTSLAEKCGVSPQYINNIVRGRQRVTEDFARTLARTLEVNLNWLYLGRGPMLWEETSDPGADTEVMAQNLLGAAESLREAVVLLRATENH